MTSVSGHVAAIYAPYLWPSSDGPRYVIGFVGSAAFSFAAIVLSWVMRFLLKRENRRARLELAEGQIINTYGY